MKTDHFSTFDSARRDRVTYAILFVLYWIALYPILRANRRYEDDLGRVLIGRTSWDATGRPLTTLLMRALQCYDHAMVDISPLTQIAALAALAWIGVLIARRFDIRSPWAAALAAFPLGAQPFFLANLSYKFDALSMGLAVFFAALPVLSHATGRRGWWLGILWMFCSLNLYQAAINVYLLYALLELVMVMLRQEPPSELRRRFIWRGSQAFTGLLIYQLLIGMTIINVNGWVGRNVNGWVGRNVRKIHRLDELLQLPKHIADFYRYIGDGFSQQWWMYFVPVLLLLAVLPWAIGLHYTWKRRKTQPIRVTASLLLTSLLLPVVGLLGVMGPMLLLVKPLLTERVMVGVGGWLSMGLIIAYAAFQRWGQSPRWMLALGGMLALGMEVMASAYGNALSEQTRYESQIASRLADDYATLEATAHVKALLLGGAAGYAPATRHAVEQMPVLGRMISPYLSAWDPFHTPQFLAYFMPNIPYISYPHGAEDSAYLSSIDAVLAKTCVMPAWGHTHAYDLYKVDDIAVAVFRQQPALHCDNVRNAALPASDAAVSDLSLVATPLRASE